MDLVLYLICFCLLLYEREYVLKFLLTSCLKTRRVMENELWVALEWKLNIDVMDSSLSHQNINNVIREMRKNHQVTFEVGLICWWKDDGSGVTSEADILPRGKLDPPLYCRPAWVASFYQHSPSR